MISFVKKEPVLCAAAFLAVITCFITLPDMDTFYAIDFRTLGILFCLMTVTSGLDEEGVLSRAASAMLSGTKSWRTVYLILVMLCFFSAMIVTNDVALITFVPFAIKTCRMTGKNDRLIKLIVMQTIAANLGSMLTPIGNPQNLYLYSLSGIGALEFMVKLMPMWAASLVFIVLTAFTEKNDRAEESRHEEYKRLKIKNIVFYGVLFVVSILCVMHAVHYVAAFVIVAAAVFVKNRRLFIKTDYTLLLTFVFFFVFIHNIKSINAVCLFFENAVCGREFISGFLLSQMISNVPAAVLLSGFTDKYMALAAGVNLGGLGTLIASMASLISYKFYSVSEKAHIKAFMLSFTKWNVVFIALLMPFAYITIRFIV